MEYQDEQGKTYEISYSQKLQEEDIRLKKFIIAIMLSGLSMLILILVLLAMIQFNGGHLGYIVRNMVC